MRVVASDTNTRAFPMSLDNRMVPGLLVKVLVNATSVVDARRSPIITSLNLK